RALAKGCSGSTDELGGLSRRRGRPPPSNICPRGGKQPKNSPPHPGGLHPLKLPCRGPPPASADRPRGTSGEHPTPPRPLGEVAGDPERFGGAQAIAPLLGRIDHRREKLEDRAMAVGRTIFKRPPDDFVQRLHGYWKDWH